MKYKDMKGLSNIEIESKEFYFREGTTDLNCINEVVLKKCYQHKAFNFYPEEGEHWLDLGGNIGAFAIFLDKFGATCDSYEPIAENYKILSNNLKQLGKGFSCHNFAVTNSRDEELEMFAGNKETDKYRFTIRNKAESFSVGNMKNKHASIFDGKFFDGVKMDIEGSEFGIIDDGLIPNCNKLVLEYHLTKDKDLNNFDIRVAQLRRIFKDVYYMPSLDKYPRDKNYPGFFDRLIYCKNRKK